MKDVANFAPPSVAKKKEKRFITLTPEGYRGSPEPLLQGVPVVKLCRGVDRLEVEVPEKLVLRQKRNVHSRFLSRFPKIQKVFGRPL
jgi:hypothetical protein